MIDDWWVDKQENSSLSLPTCFGQTPRVCNANACSRFVGKLSRIQPRRIQSKSFKRSSYNWAQRSAETFFYENKYQLNRLTRSTCLRLTIDGWGGNLSFILLGASRNKSSGSITTLFNFFCNIFAIVCRPEAGAPRIITFGAKQNETNRRTMRSRNVLLFRSFYHRYLSWENRSNMSKDLWVDRLTLLKCIAKEREKNRSISRLFVKNESIGKTMSTCDCVKFNIWIDKQFITWNNSNSACWSA